MKRGNLIRPKETEMVVKIFEIVKNIYDKIVRLDPLKKDNISKHRVQTAIKSFTCSYLNVDLKNKTKTQ